MDETGGGTIGQCSNCGAPWRPDITGACSFCRVVVPQPTSGGFTVAAPGVDPVVLFGILRQMAADPAAPVDGLARGLGPVLGDHLKPFRDRSGGSGMVIQIEDFTYQAAPGEWGVDTGVVHTVRGIVLKRESLGLDEWLGRLASHLADLAGRNPQVKTRLVALGR